MGRISRQDFFIYIKKTNRLSRICCGQVFMEVSSLLEENLWVCCSTCMCRIFCRKNHQPDFNMSQNVASRFELNKLTHLSTLADQNKFLLFLRITRPLVKRSTSRIIFIIKLTDMSGMCCGKKYSLNIWNFGLFHIKIWGLFLNPISVPFIFVRFLAAKLLTGFRHVLMCGLKI
jgi:hypothetical protein